MIFFLQHSGGGSDRQQRRILQCFIHTRGAGSLLRVGVCQSPTRQGTKPAAGVPHSKMSALFLCLHPDPAALLLKLQHQLLITPRPVSSSAC